MSFISTTNSSLRALIGLAGIICWQAVVGAAENPVTVQPAVAEQTAAQVRARNRQQFSGAYRDNCAVCHGEQLQGAAQGVPLQGKLAYGDGIEALTTSISRGYPDRGMPAWEGSLSPDIIRNLAIYIAEQRMGIDVFMDFNIYNPMRIPTEPVVTEKYRVSVEVVIEGLEPLLYSMAPLPDGRILLGEKLRGLSVISASGEQSALIEGMPKIYSDAYSHEWGPNKRGTGWMLDVVLHPQYENNGWIYVSYGDRCEDCNAVSREYGVPVSMNTLIRGRLKEGRWVDSEVIWQTGRENYTARQDVMAGGRIAFDDGGHVFLTVGDKGFQRSGIQDLTKPYGKIHRVFDDGRIPEDNPFYHAEGAVKSTWTYGHRSPQGLEYDLVRGELWGTEMGPRGGDELNLLVRGGNFGWPLFSLGADYNGSFVNDGERLGIEWKMEDIQQPVVDLTPGPAVSSFVIYQGSAFPNWRNQFIVGSLKGTNLYRFAIQDGELIHRELMLSGMGRIRDVEVDPQGKILLLLEHDAGGKIVRLHPD